MFRYIYQSVVTYTVKITREKKMETSDAFAKLQKKTDIAMISGFSFQVNS